MNIRSEQVYEHADKFLVNADINSSEVFTGTYAKKLIYGPMAHEFEIRAYRNDTMFAPVCHFKR